MYPAIHDSATFTGMRPIVERFSGTLELSYLTTFVPRTVVTLDDEWFYTWEENLIILPLIGSSSGWALALASAKTKPAERIVDRKRTINLRWLISDYFFNK